MPDNVMTPEFLRQVYTKVEQVRLEIVGAEPDGMSPEAEQYVMLSLDTLAQAMRFLTLAKYTPNAETVRGERMTMAKTRRSIVDLESWLTREIAQVKASLQELVFEAEAVARKRALDEVRLETLLRVQSQVERMPTRTEDANGDEATFEEPTGSLQ